MIWKSKHQEHIPPEIMIHTRPPPPPNKPRPYRPRPCPHYSSPRCVIIKNCWLLLNKNMKYTDCNLINRTSQLFQSYVKFIYFEKAKNFLQNLHRRFDLYYIEFCGLLRIYELDMKNWRHIKCVTLKKIPTVILSVLLYLFKCNTRYLT